MNNALRLLTAPTLLALSLIALAALSGCEKNTVEISTPPEQAESGSFAASNTAQCLPDVSLVDQHGTAVSLASLKGKPVLIDFIYTTCPTLCPLLTAKLAAVAKLLGPRLGSEVTFVSITIDPEHDHPRQLLDYAKSHEANDEGWLFLTGTPAQVEGVLKLFKIKRRINPNGSIDHVALGFLLGPDGHQVRQYETLQVPPQVVVGDISRVNARG
ncbi:MAG: SCO family protein [Candidatus Binataceae bacterium]